MQPIERKVLMLKGKLKQLVRTHNFLKQDYMFSENGRNKVINALAQARTEIINLKRTIKRGGALGAAPITFDAKYMPSYEAVCKHFTYLIKAYKDGADICMYLNPDPNDVKTIDSPIVKWKLIKDGDEFLDAEFCGEYTLATLE